MFVFLQFYGVFRIIDTFANKFVFLLKMHADVYAHEECERDNIRNKFAKMFAGDGEQGQMPRHDLLAYDHRTHLHIVDCATEACIEVQWFTGSIQ